MTDRTRKLIDGVRRFSPLLQAFEAGHTVEDVRAMVHATLEPEFQNPRMMDRYGVDLLAVEAVNISKINSSPEWKALYNACMDVQISVLRKDSDRCARIFAAWEQDIGEGLQLYWNTSRFEVDKENLPIDEFSFEVFRNIGGLLEATTQPYLRELLHLFLEAAGEVQEKSDIQKLTFGSVMAKLEAIGPGALLLRPQPSNISLNQWRNIAQHFSVNTNGVAITCHYGNFKQHTITFTRDELWNALTSLISMHRAIRTAHTIFFLDHANVLVSHCRGYKRKDSDLQFHFLVGAASQGFEVTSLSVAEGVAEAELCDLTLGEPMPRAFHASQFVVTLWQATAAEKVTITYRAKAGQVFLRAYVSGKYCEQISSGELDIKNLADFVEFNFV